ncbi:MAG: membrane protein insertase YidC [Candidatus Krumholzibacteria bacterium]|nr:membrane protein insertase YidC [Candidatus Krumholzibacteria bacterium]MDH4336777.1 membrane protein insertase YidC [Candidatus Krumholzibacteria bacterium]MDH5269456.1 membrane protein insertase YidC [Candidatus Krumholzibacteria bacterium]
MSKGFSMERRALIAFVASMALFFGYDALFLAPKMKKERARRQAEALEQGTLATREPAADTLRPGREATPPATALTAPADTSARVTAEVFATPEETPSQTITIVTPLFEIKLDTRGAVITSVKLLNYLTRDEPVELLPAGDSWSGTRMLSTRVDGPAADLDLDDVVFGASAGGDVLPDGARVVVSGSEPVDLVFRAEGSGGVVERSYRFFGDRYDFETRLSMSEALAPEAENVGWSLGPGLASTEANVGNDQSAFRATVLLGEEKHRRKPGDFGRSHVEDYSGTFNWAALQSKYFMVALYPQQPTRAEVQMSGIKAEHRISETIAVPAGVARGQVTSMMHVYMGPMSFDTVAALGVGLEKNIELGMKFIRPVSELVLKALKALYHVIPNYGWVIVIISVLTKVLFYRLTHKSFKSMKEMQDLQPRLQALKEKYGDDRRRVSEETMKLYKEAGVNPLGGCLPMVLQMPVFIALFNVLQYTIELRGAPWLGWINDLSQQDVLFKLPLSLPLIGDNFSLLPLLMGASMWAQSKLGGSPTGQANTAIPPGFNTMLPIVFTVLFYKMPSGLVIYWIINTVISVAQQYYIVKDSRHAEPAAVVVEPAPRKKARSGGRKGR